MAKTIEQLKAQGAEVKNATVVGENTATRVGTLFNDIVEYVEAYEQAQAQNDESLNKAIVAETARAKAAEEEIAYYEDNPEFIRAYMDADGRLLWWINTDGSIGWAHGVPQPIHEELKKLEQLINDNFTGDEQLKERVAANEGAIVAINETLDRKVDGVYEDNPEFINVKTDADDKIISGVTVDGINYLPNTNIDNLMLNGVNVDNDFIRSIYYIESPEFIKVIVDEDNKIIIAVRHDGTIFSSQINDYTNENFVRGYVDNAIAEYEGISASEKKKLNTIKILPDYWDTYLNEKIQTINNNTFDNKLPFDSFIFITDIHCYGNIGYSKLVLNELIKRTTSKKVIFGGDIPGGKVPDGAEWEDARALLVREMMSYEDFQNSVHPQGQWLPCRGNHDLTAIEIVYLGANEQGMPQYKVTFRDGLKKAAITNLFTSNLNLYPNIFIGNDEDCVYYFSDNKEAKIRYIVMDGNKTLDNGDVGGYGFSDRQLKWVIENAILTADDGYGFVFINHEPITQRLASGHAMAWQKLRILCKAIRNRTNFTVGEQLYDFSNIKTDVIMVLAGHEHCDGEIYDDGVLNVVSACDTFNGDVRYSMYIADKLEARTKGTVSEQIVDYVIVKPQDKAVFFKRIGWGRDRLFHTETININVGETYEIPFINENITEIKATDTNITDYMSTADTEAISIGNNSITALSTGDIMLVGFDSDYNAEFFNIKIS